MKYTTFYILTFCTFIFISCSVKPEPINWGKDACSYCKMNIVDKMHAAEYVTSKGKVHKFDAIECLVRDLISNDFPEAKFTLVCDYGNEGVFIDAQTATFLISNKIPSPMGENLSAFSKKSDATDVNEDGNGSLYSWEDLISKFKK